MITPSQRFYQGTGATPRKILNGMDRGIHGWVGAWNRRKTAFRRLEKEARKVIRLFEKKISNLSEDEFRDRLNTVHGNLLRGRDDRATRIEGMACAMRAARDVLDLTPYPVQVIGALAIDQGRFAEMATGEGKTLTIGLAGILAGWRKKPCHVITSNDYLAERDAESLRELYQYCGLDVGFVTGEHKPDQRVAQYAQPVVYTTSQQLLADYLKDRISLGEMQSPESQLIRQIGGDRKTKSLTTRGIHTVIIDEADNILIDEAVTPLIISQVMKGESFDRCCQSARDLVWTLTPGKDYRIDYKHSEITLLNEGKNRIQRHRHRLPPVWRSLNRSEELVRQALIAEHFFELDRNYVISDGEVEIVDESTGRIMPGRTWKQGLHQAIEAKEKIAVSDPTETLASMSFQRFFRSFHKISGVSGTAWESRGELWRIYELAVFQIPTHCPVQRIIEATKVFAKSEQRDQAVVEEIKRVRDSGRPVLVGTRSVESSERISRLLEKEILPHSILNAVRHEEEARVIAEAGQSCCITIATNMAGRGTDIKISEEGKANGGLHVIVAECNLSSRIDRQLIGRSSRQGEKGSARCYVCPEDELFRRFLKKAGRKPLAEARGFQGGRIATRHLKRAQRTSEKMGASQRAAMLKMDTWMDENLSFTRLESR